MVFTIQINYHSNVAVFSYGAIYLVFSSNLCVCGKNPMV